MKKRLLKNVLLALSFLLFTAGSASGMTFSPPTLLDGPAVYYDTGAEYVSLTDLTEPVSAPMVLLANSFDAYFQIGVCGAGCQGVSSSLAVIDTYQGVLSSNLLFDLGSGTAASGLDSGPLGTTFGLYFRPYAEPGVLGDRVYYSDNDPGEGDVFSIFHDPWGISSARYAEVVVGVDLAGEQALFYMKDVAPAAVPLPTSLILFGSGLASLGLIARRKAQAE